MPEEQDFQRARRPEQVAARREAILSTAEAMLREQSVAEVTLVQLSQRTGMAKSGLLRYFDSREAIFLEVLDRAREAWLERLAAELPGAPEVAVVIARSLIADPLLCDLIAAMAGVLERNISVEFARGFKQRAAAHHRRLAELIRTARPELTAAGADHFAGAVFIITAGLWPYAKPTAAVRQVMSEMRVPDPADMFAVNLTEGLTNQLAGLVARERQSLDRSAPGTLRT